MAHFQCAMISIECTKKIFELFLIFRRVLEARWILQKKGTEAIGLHERVEVVSKRFHIGSRELRFLMREAAENFRREFEVGIGADAADPTARMRRRRNAVER